MKFRIFVILPLAAASLWAQQVTDRMSASIRGGGGGEGKCTIELEVDGVADVEIRGTEARIRNISGSGANFRRFECNQAMVVNPSGFRFKGIDGRGRQTLVRNPGGNSPAVIRIEDSKGGREGYTFDIFWSGGGGGPNDGDDGGFGNGNGRVFGNRNGNGNGGVFGNGNGNNGGVFGNDNRQSGNWGNNGAWGNNNSTGWSNNWDNNIDFRGRGDGYFRGQRGTSINLNDCVATIDRSGNVTIFFDTNNNHDLRFNGQINRITNDVIYARLNGFDVEGLMQIRLRGRNRIADVSMNGGNGRNRFDLRWNN